MSIALSDIKLRGCATDPEDDTTTAIGGAIDLTTKLEFYDVAAAIQIVSSSASDTTQSVTVSYLDAGGNIQTEAKTLNGRTPVAITAVPNRLMKAVKSATCAGVVAVEAVTGERTGTAQAGSATTLQLDTGASAVDGYYNSMVLRITAATGQYDINQIIDYNGTTKVATLAFAASVPLDGTTAFKVSKGMVFDKLPDEILTVKRIAYNAAAPAPGASSVKVYGKFFIKNTHASLDLTSDQAIELADPSGLMAFAVVATLGDTGTNGTGNTRLTAPAGLTFDSTAKAGANGAVLTHGTAQGVWYELTRAAGAAAIQSTWTPEMYGGTF